MKKTIHDLTAVSLCALAIVLICVSCSWWSKGVEPAVQAGIDCAKAEQAKVTGGQSVVYEVIDVAYQFAATVALGGDVEKLVTQLVLQYGEPIVACAVQRIAAHPLATSSGTGLKTSTGDPLAMKAAQLITKRGWKFAKPAAAR